GLFERAVDLLDGHQRRGTGTHQSRRRCCDTQCGGADIVRQIRDQIDVVLAEREILALELAAEALDRSGDCLPSSGGLVSSQALQTFRTVGCGYQIFGHCVPSLRASLRLETRI